MWEPHGRPEWKLHGVRNSWFPTTASPGARKAPDIEQLLRNRRELRASSAPGQLLLLPLQGSTQTATLPAPAMKMPLGTPASLSRLPGPISNSSSLLMHTLEDSRGWPKRSDPFHLYGRPGLSSWLPASSWPRPGCHRRLGSKRADGRFLCASVCHTLPFRYGFKRIHKLTHTQGTHMHTHAHTRTQVAASIRVQFQMSRLGPQNLRS